MQGKHLHMRSDEWKQFDASFVVCKLNGPFGYNVLWCDLACTTYIFSANHNGYTETDEAVTLCDTARIGSTLPHDLRK